MPVSRIFFFFGSCLEFFWAKIWNFLVFFGSHMVHVWKKQFCGFSIQVLILVVYDDILYNFLLVIPNLNIHLYFLLNKCSRNITTTPFNFHRLFCSQQTRGFFWNYFGSCVVHVWKKQFCVFFYTITHFGRYC